MYEVLCVLCANQAMTRGMRGQFIIKTSICTLVCGKHRMFIVINV